MLRLVLFNLWISSHRELPKKIVEKKEVPPTYITISQQIYSKKNDSQSYKNKTVNGS